MIMGRYLGSNMDMGSAMTAKILKEYRDVMCRSTLRGLTSAKMENPVHIDSCRRFYELIGRKLVLNAVLTEFEKKLHYSRI